MSQRLTLKQERSPLYNLGHSRILEVLGPDMFATVTAVTVPGKVIWCNFDLARALGFDVPAVNSMSPDLHEQLLQAISFKALQPEEDAGNQPTVTLYADKYGGDGIAPALGSSRSAFLPFGNLFIKGVGFTPLFRHNDPEDFSHSHGGLGMDEAVSEAMWGEINAKLFGKDSARVLAIIDLDDYTVWPDGSRIPRVVIARCGNQLRPAHVLARRGRGERSRLDLFISITRETGQLVTRKGAMGGEGIPDIKATMLRVIDDHARTSAEQVRWRISHNALSTSNMQMNGGMLDVPSQSAHPRTTSIRPPDHELVFEKHFNSDLYDRPEQLKRLYRAILRSSPRHQRDRVNAKWMNVKSVMDKTYRKHLEVELLAAAGLKKRLAERLAAELGELARRFAEVITEMTELKNPGSVNRSRYLIEDVAVLDVFNLLGNYPRIYFDNPAADHSESIRALLAPIYKGNKYHVEKKKAAVNLAIKEFQDVYRDLMCAVESFDEEFYCGARGMKASITARAEFENRPAPLLYRMDFFDTLYKSIAEFKRTGNLEIMRDLIDRRVSASLRSIDALLAQGGCRRMAGGGFEFEMLSVNGINYSVRAWDDQAETRRLHVSFPVERRGEYFVTFLPGRPRIALKQTGSLLYRFTTDGGSSWHETAMRLERRSKNQYLISSDCINTFPPAGELQGFFYDSHCDDLCLKEGEHDFRGYVFAIPDRQELFDLVKARLK